MAAVMDLLMALLVGFMVTMAVVTATVVGGTYWFLRHRRRHRGVPLSWGVSHSRAARLHRRLHYQCDRAQFAINRSRARGLEPVLLEGAVDELMRQALVLDARLVDASQLPMRDRNRQLATLRWRVIEHGRLATRVSLMATDVGLPELATTDATLAEVSVQLQALAAARHELRSA